LGGATSRFSPLSLFFYKAGRCPPFFFFFFLFRGAGFRRLPRPPEVFSPLFPSAGRKRLFFFLGRHQPAAFKSRGRSCPFSPQDRMKRPPLWSSSLPWTVAELVFLMVHPFFFFPPLRVEAVHPLFFFFSLFQEDKRGLDWKG